MRHPSKFSCLFLISVFLVTHCASAIAAESNGKPAKINYPSFKYSETAAEPVIEYNLVHEMLAEPDPEPLLRIYGNGRVHVHYPAYMKKAGDYELQLSKPELNQLIHNLAIDGIIDFDMESTKRQRKQFKKQQRDQTGTLFYVSDSSNTVIDIRLGEYQENPVSKKIKNLHRQFIWPNLKQDAQRFPRSQEIRNANSAAQRLNTLTQHHDLVKVR